MMRRLVLGVVLFAACGDNSSPPGGGDAGTDGPQAATLTSFVIDLVKNQTSDHTQPIAFDQFATLLDPDLNNADPTNGGYSSLFQ